jgi:hypothetical protein
MSRDPSRQSTTSTHGLDYNDRLGVRSHDLLDELVGAAGQAQHVPVVTLRLPLGVETDDRDDDISLLRRLDRLLHEHFGVIDLRATKLHAGVRVHDLLVLVPVGRTADIHVLDADLGRLASLERETTALLASSRAEEGVTPALARPVVDDELVVNEQLQQHETTPLLRIPRRTFARPATLRPNSNLQSRSRGLS